MKYLSKEKNGDFYGIGNICNYSITLIDLNINCLLLTLEINLTITKCFFFFCLFVGHSINQGASDQCSVDKYALENEGTIQYDTAIQKLDQFTLCAWMRFTNHKGDHSIFTYSGK